MLIFFAVIAGTFGIITLRIGLRGRRVDEHPICRRCEFDLTGKPEASSACAECGSDLRRPSAIQMGHRRRNNRSIIAGLVLLLTSLSIGGFDLAERTHSIRWIEYEPVKWLLYRAQGSSSPAETEALNELLSRARNQTLNPFQTAATVAVALTMQGDLHRPWNPLWGALIEFERANTVVTDSQWALYARQALQDAFGFCARPSVRLGDALPYRLEAKKGRTATVTSLGVMLSSTSVGFVDSSEPASPSVSTGPNSFTGGFSSGSSLNPERFPKDIGFGRHIFRFQGTVRVGDPKRAFDISPIVTQTIEMQCPVNVQPPNEPTVHAVMNPAMAGVIRAAMRIDLRFPLNQIYAPQSQVVVSSAPVALSFDAYCLIEGKEYPLGSFACPAGSRNMGWGMQSSAPFRRLFDMSHASTSHSAAMPHTTIILRSDPGPAVLSTDVFSYWQGEILIKDIPILAN